MQQQSAQNLTVANTEDIVTTSQKPKKGKSEICILSRLLTI